MSKTERFKGDLRLAKQGCMYSQVDLAIHYAKGLEGAKKDYKKSLFWLREAANQGSATAEEYIDVVNDMIRLEKEIKKTSFMCFLCSKLCDFLKKLTGNKNL